MEKPIGLVSKERRALEKELFQMVYMWGRFGIGTDELCSAFQDLIRKIKESK